MLDLYTQNIVPENFKNVRKAVLENLTMLMEQYFSNKPMFIDKNAWELYYHDELAVNTNVCQQTIITMYLELNSASNKKSDNITKAKKKARLSYDAFLTLKAVKKELKTLLLQNLSSYNTVEITKFSILIQNNEPNEAGKEQNLIIKIIPCFTHINQDNKKGIIYWDDTMRQVEIEYPKLAIKNYNTKNKATKGLYSKYVVLCKTLFREEKKPYTLPFEVFETLIYNVPNDLFQDLSVKNAYIILNFLRNFNIKDYKTLDEQDYAFVSLHRSMSALYVKHVISKIEKGLKHLR